MHEVLVNRLGGLSLPRKSVVRLTDRPDMTLDVYRGRKTTMQQHSLTRELRIRVVGFALKKLFTHFEMLVISYALHCANGHYFVFYLF